MLYVLAFFAGPLLFAGFLLYGLKRLDRFGVPDAPRATGTPLVDIVRDVATRARNGGLSVEEDGLGNIVLTFPVGAWYVAPEEDCVYLDDEQDVRYREELEQLTAELPDEDVETLELYAAHRVIDFAA